MRLRDIAQATRYNAVRYVFLRRFMEGSRPTLRARLSTFFPIGRVDPTPHAASRSPRPAASHSPWVVLLLCWGLALGLGAHVGRELRLETERDVALGDGTAWQAAAAGVLAGVGELTGVAQLRAVLHEPVRAFYGTAFTVGGRPFQPPAAADEAEPEAVKSEAAEPEAAVPAPRRVMIVGASSIQFGLGRSLERWIERFQGVTVMRYGLHSTGLARPDYFDWHAKAREMKDEFQPDLVIAQFGGNDGQGLTDRDTGGAVAPLFTDAWDEVYGARVETFVEIFAEDEVPVVILGMPAMKSAYHQRKMARINEVTEAACARTGAWFVDTFAMTADADGNYVARAEVEGRLRVIRASDGMHLNSYGAELVTAGILDVLGDWFAFTLPEAPAHAVGDALPGDGRGLLLERGEGRDARVIAGGGSPADLGRPGSPAVETELGLNRRTRRLIQRGLLAEGFDPGPADGLFGPRTRAALRAWQSARGAAATGYLNGGSAAALRAAAPDR